MWQALRQFKVVAVAYFSYFILISDYRLEKYCHCAGIPILSQNFPQGQRLNRRSVSYLGTIQSPFLWLSGTLLTVIKRRGCLGAQLPSTNDELKNERIYTCIYPFSFTFKREKQ